jgi:cysteine desulfurase/selenocysteine lyase
MSSSTAHWDGNAGAAVQSPHMDWTAFRAQCPVTHHWAFLDHAAVAPLPAPAVAALREYADDLAANGVTQFTRWQRRAEEVRGLAARLLNADAHDVCFVPNTTAGVNLVAEGFPWEPGDNVVTSADEYPTNQYPWMNLAARGVELRRVPSHGPRVQLDDLLAAMDSRTRLVTLSFVQYSTGFRADLDAVGEACRERGAYFFVDAIQGLGVLPLDVARQPIDFLAADGHKWLLGPEGLGVAWVRRELLDLLRPIGVGWNSVVGGHDFGNIDFRLKPHAGRYEGGTANFAGITAFGASLGMLLDAGLPAVGERVLALTDYLCERSASAGLEVFSARGDGEKSGIVALTVPGVPASEASRRCRNAGVAVTHRGGRVRVSPHCYNTEDEIDRLIELLRLAGP